MTELAFSFIAIILIACAIPTIILLLSSFLGKKKDTIVKMESYESGVKNVVGSVKERFSIRFYLIAILFIVFDVETVFMFPWAVTFKELGFDGFVSMIIFIGILLAGYIYIIRKGALKWD
ncbi:MAG: NADH-quinone oxidoreductase subunit A 1 [Candidatus Sericytochromatia bacterium]|nr:MAG: NADH-quinone oxidoreductase subunit A 1 [Candidatus Sericytochromatia bacterium]